MFKVGIPLHQEQKPIFDTKIFLVASGYSDFVALFRAKYPYILTSFFFKDKVFSNGIRSLKDLYESCGEDPSNYELFIDSGSYSITAGKKKLTEDEVFKYMDDYVEYLYNEQGYYTHYCNLDMQFNEKMSKRCYYHLCANGLHHSVQVHHRPERFRFWDEIYNNYSPDIGGLSPQPMCSPALKYEYVKRCFAMNPNNKVHLFGSVDYKIAKSFNVYSMDSSGVSRMSSMGTIRTPHGTFSFGARKDVPDHIYNQPTEKLKKVEKFLNSLGYKLSDVSEERKGVSRERFHLNILSSLKMMEDIKKNKQLIELPSRKEILRLPYTDAFGSYEKDGIPSADWK